MRKSICTSLCRVWYRSSILLPLLLAFVPTYAQLPQPDLDDSKWGCYNPRPGHPTIEEKTIFVNYVKPLAQEMERQGGPPAAGVIAIAANESGFGWTRTALMANNLFGWKFTGLTASGGRSYWALACQPDSDPNNKYVVFHDRADSIRFVAGRFADSPRYKAVTVRYRSDRSAAVGSESAVRTWVKGIAAAGFNPNPDYSDTVVKIANDFTKPSSEVSRQYSLYQFSDEIPANRTR